MLYALPISVYRDARICDCTNGGISSRYDKLLLICDRGFIKIDERFPPENLVKIVTKNYGGEVYKYLEPCQPVKEGHLGYMFGGNVAYSCDSRFSELSGYPIKIHDRTETPEQNRLYGD